MQLQCELNDIYDSQKPHPRGMTKKGPFWLFSSLPISLHHINEVISCGVAAQSDVGVEDLVLCQDTLNSILIQLRLDTLMREGMTGMISTQYSDLI